MAQMALANIKTDGVFYRYLQTKNQYDRTYRKCMERTAEQLIEQQTSHKKPGMLLGKIQSGKTRMFLGIMGLMYDNQYDVIIILTKGTKALVQQTIARLHTEFQEMIHTDQLDVYDIMQMPTNLSRWELQKKLALVVKKESRNMDKLKEALFEQYPDLSKKKILFIDDEADFASVSYENNREKNLTEMRVIASKIDEMRSLIARASFLQVTATPYSLYLQPDQMEIHEFKKFQPLRPAFTELVPVHDQYIGGEVYFEESKDKQSPAYFLYEEITENDLVIMKKSDLRRVKKERILQQDNTKNLSKAVIQFITGSCIRRFEQRQLGQNEEKYAMIIHTERGKEAHLWQQELICLIIEHLKMLANTNNKLFHEVVKDACKNLARSLKFTSRVRLKYSKILEEVRRSLIEEMTIVSVVNSDKDVEELLDASGQLRLRTPMNIFIGGQILDRGVTISNLIGFFYGRNPRSFQQDTVLQHSRMYGARSRADLAVTRFYTTQKIYQVMENIHEFDTELRRAFEEGGQDRGVVFIQKDMSNEIIPCNPNKILLSNIITLRPHKRMLPVGFQTGPKSKIARTVERITQKVHKLRDTAIEKNEDAFLVPLALAKEILTEIHRTLIMENGYEWDLNEYLSILDYLTMDESQKGVWLIVRKGRGISRFDGEGRYENAPDTPSGEKGELSVAKRVASDLPALILLKQTGKEEKGWRDTPFWWPVLITPKNAQTTVYARETIAD